MDDFFTDLDKELSGSDTDDNAAKSVEIKKNFLRNNGKVEKKDTSSTQTKKTENQKITNQKTGNQKGERSKKPRNSQPLKPSQKQTSGERQIKGKFVSTFPDTKFYLPSLREGYTRFVPIGGNNETGSKNMNMAQYKDDIVIVDCGVQFTDATLPGVNYSIPDVSFLTKYKKNIKGMIITHAHLDHIGALKHILPALGMPPIYGTKLTIGFVKKQLVEAGLLDYATLIEVDAGSTKKIKMGEFQVEFFKVNHSVPDCAGVCIESPGGAKFVHTGDFKIDHTPAIDDPADLDRISAIGKKGVTLLLSDSTGSTRKGFSMSEKNVGEALEAIVRDHHKGRLIIAAFSSWISRVQQLIDICDKYGKTIFLSGRSMVENVAIAKELGYLKIKPGIIKKMTPKNTEGILPHKQVIITTGSQGEQFSALSRMAEGRHNSVEIIKGDTVVFSSSIVPGNDRSVVAIINKLIKLGANVLTKDDGEFHTGGHAFQEEQKIMLDLVKPKYFAPVFGDLYFRTVHKNTAVSMGFHPENVLMLENGNIIDFAPKGLSVFKSRIKVPIQEIIIDSNAMGLASSHVIKAREKMMHSGVLVINYKVDKKTRAILGHIKLETRGLVYLEEVRYIHRMILKKAKELYENTVLDVPDIPEKDLLKIVRTDLEKFILSKVDREPMIIPMVIEV